MKSETQLPFIIGESVEEKSFTIGYRGAWFRGTLKEINLKTGKCLLEYCDYPDDKPSWVNLYKKPPHLRRKGQSYNRELVLRPCYPPIYNEDEMRRDSDIPEVALVKTGWQLGDLVDWLYNFCWWTGEIVELLGDGKAKVEFLPPPLGEGTVEEVLLEDIRPSLDWSLEDGWTVPTQKSGHACAQLIRPTNLVPVPIEGDIQNCVEETGVLIESSDKPSLLPPLSSSLEQKGMGLTTDAQKELLENKVPMKRNSSSLEMKGMGLTTDAQKDLLENKVPTKRKELIRTDTSSGYPVKQREVALNSIPQPNPAVSAIWDLEDCLRRVKWFKSILLTGDSVSDDASKPRWEYLSE